jgi:hypothetical protein
MAAKDPQRRYDKGERRIKHIGKGPVAAIDFDDHDPKKWVGKCPPSISQAERVRLLRQAIPAPNGDRELAVPKKLCVVHEGAIYQAQTSDGGATYHAYPYRGKLSGALLTKLEDMPREGGCADAFRDWVKRHIQRHGGSK